MVCRCTKCNKDFFTSDNTLYLKTGLCVHCRNLALTPPPTPPTPPASPSRVVKSVKSANVPRPAVKKAVPQSQQSIRLSTILLILTMIVIIIWQYVLPEVNSYEKNYISDYKDLTQVVEKDYTIKYSPDLPYAEVIVEAGVVVGYNVIEPYITTPQQVLIPHNVTEIADNAFADFYGLVGVTFSNNLIRVGKHAFDNCYNLQYVATNEKLEVIDDYAFENLEITTISLPTSLDYLGVSALNKVNINDISLSTETRLGSACLNFVGYSPNGDDEEVIINNLYIKASTQANSNVIIPDGVTSIEDYAFYSSEIKSIVIPEGVTYIGPRAFMLCKNLQEVTFPSTLMAIDEFAFYNCTALTKVNFNHELKIIAYQAFAGTKIDQNDIPSTIKILDASFL